MTSRFQRQLMNQALKKIILLLIVGCFSLWLGFFIMTIFVNEEHARTNLNHLRDVYEEVDAQNLQFLSNENVIDTTKKLFAREISEEEYLSKIFYKKTLFTITNDLVITDINGTVFFTTYSDKELSNYRLNYNNAVCYHAQEDGGAVYHSVYYEKGEFSDYIYVMPVNTGNEIVGYISLFMSGSDWNYYLSDDNYDGVITDSRGNVIFCSKAGFLGKVGKYVLSGKKREKIGEDIYWVTSTKLQEDKVIIYSLIYTPKNSMWIIAILMMLCLGAAWFGIAHSMAVSMAENNARSIQNLVSEIRIIRKDDREYRLKNGQDNEFDEVARQINKMLDHIKKLDDENIELVKINSRTELAHLTAQINPHFLYNTLEIIRNLTLMDPPKASELITELVRILRYSVDQTNQDVKLLEDLTYINSYLNIQRTRYGERFICDISFEAECDSCTIPKLLLQPFIENSIKYGFQNSMEICVKIHGWVEGSQLLITIEDDGPGIEQDKMEILNKIIREKFHNTASNGIHNICRRLILQYGNNSGVCLYSVSGGGCGVRIIIEQSGGHPDV